MTQNGRRSVDDSLQSLERARQLKESTVIFRPSYSNPCVGVTLALRLTGSHYTWANICGCCVPI